MTDPTPLPPPPSPPPTPVPGSEPWRQVRTRQPSPASPSGALFLLIGSGMLLIGLTLPRLTIDYGSYALVYRGTFLATIALVVAGLFELVWAGGMMRGASGSLAPVLAGVIVAIVAYQLLDAMWIADGFRNPGIEVSVGPGAVLIGLAGAMIGAGGVLAWRPRR